MKYGYITVASAIPSVKVADCQHNIDSILELIFEADKNNVEIVVFPELSVTGYSCQDLFRGQSLIDNAEMAVIKLLNETRKMDIISIVGVPVVAKGILLNCAAVIQKGKVLGLVPKTYLPNYNEFYEKRWFASAQDLNPCEIWFAGSPITISNTPKIFTTSSGASFGVEICEDVWAPTPPSNTLSLAGASLIFNLSASNELIGKHDYLLSLLSQQSARTISGYIYSGCGYGESTQDVVYGGNALIYENGKLVAQSTRFSLNPQLIISQIDVEKLLLERRNNTTFVNAQRHVSAENINCQSTETKPFTLLRGIDPHPFIPSSGDMQRNCQEIFNIQVMGLAKRMQHTGSKTAVIGVSGGLDSTLALLVIVKTFDKLQLSRSGIIGVTMPGFGTTDRTYNNAMKLMQALGITIKEINISDAVIQHFKDIGHDRNTHDTTYENSQARERTQILMDLSNKYGGMVIGTGDLSELALGWATYNGDHISMYGVNAGVPKTLIRYLVKYVADYETLEITNGNGEEIKSLLMDVIDTPISPELIPADEQGNISQKTEDLVGPYELHDFFLYHFMRSGFSPKKIYMLATAAFCNNPTVNSYSEETIKHWIKVFFKRFFTQQFKRSCLPDGPKVGSVSISPRGDWRMPSDASYQGYLNECEEL